MSNELKSNLPNADMQAAPRALLRAARRARQIAYETKTPLVIVRNGVLVHEMITDLEASLAEVADEEPEERD
jgi:DNA-directed RNA polymerase subunit K/omega